MWWKSKHFHQVVNLGNIVNNTRGSAAFLQPAWVCIVQVVPVCSFLRCASRTLPQCSADPSCNLWVQQPTGERGSGGLGLVQTTVLQPTTPWLRPFQDRQRCPLSICSSAVLSSPGQHLLPPTNQHQITPYDGLNWWGDGLNWVW